MVVINLKGKYIGLILLLIFIFTIFLTFTTSADTYQVTIPASYDGYITNYKTPGTYIRTDDASYNIVTHEGPTFGNWQRKAFIQWNISVISPLAEILNIGITLKGAGSSQYWPNCETSYMHNLTVVPSQEIDNNPGNNNIYNGGHTVIFDFMGACTVGCGANSCPYPSTTINSVNTTLGGDYWFANFETNLEATDSVRDALPVGYYSIIFSQDFNLAITPTYSYYYSEGSGVFTPLLWVEYELTIPESNDSYPADFQEDVGWDATGINLSMNISHDNNDLMNMTWWAYNESSETFRDFRTNRF